MFKKILLAITIITLSGCAQLAGLADKAADINDESLVSAEFVICSAASTGAVQRRYNSKGLLEARKVICSNDIVIIEP